MRIVSRIIYVVFFSLLIFTFGNTPTFAQTNTNDSYLHARVINVQERQRDDTTDQGQIPQRVTIQFEEGNEKGQNTTIDFIDAFTLKSGDEVVVNKISQEGNDPYYVITGHDRTWPLIILFIIFAALVVAFTRIKGITSMLGLVFSMAILGLYVAPEILHGGNPLIVSLIGSLIIAVVSLYLAHGVTFRTSVSLASTLLTLLISVFFSWAFVAFTQLTGTGSEDAYSLQLSATQAINLQGLLLGGIIIGILGVLDDVTTTQTSTIEELQLANPSLGVRELYVRGLRVGKEHIASLVNTLALAYAGSSLPLFLIFTLNKNQPLWVILSSENLAEELVRTLIGSAALVLAVPISTLLAALAFGKKKKKVAIVQSHSWKKQL